VATAYKTQQIVGTSSTSTYSTLYSTGASTTAVVSAIHICNEAASTVTVRIGFDTTAGTPASGEFLAYDWTVPAGSTLTWNGPLTMGNTTYIRVSSSATTCTFTAAVAEVS
jgi:hydrogenase maturation factor HypE